MPIVIATEAAISIKQGTNFSSHIWLPWCNIVVTRLNGFAFVLMFTLLSAQFYGCRGFCKVFISILKTPMVRERAINWRKLTLFCLEGISTRRDQ